MSELVIVGWNSSKIQGKEVFVYPNWTIAIFSKMFSESAKKIHRILLVHGLEWSVTLQTIFSSTFLLLQINNQEYISIYLAGNCESLLKIGVKINCFNTLVLKMTTTPLIHRQRDWKLDPKPINCELAPELI